METIHVATEKFQNLTSRLIQTSSTTRARNGEHFDFMYDIKSIIGDQYPSQLHFADLWDEFKALWIIEDAAYKLIRSYQLTSEVKRLDEERQIPYRFIMSNVKSNLINSKADIKQAATNLSYVLKPFQNAQRKGMTERSALLTNMVEDLLLPANASAVSKLALAPEITQLQSKNELFKEVFLVRADAKDQRSAMEKMKAIRPQVDETYRLMIQLINSAFLSNEVAPTPDPALRAMLNSIMSAIDARILELNNLIHNREAKAQSKKEKDNPDTEL